MPPPRHLVISRSRRTHHLLVDVASFAAAQLDVGWPAAWPYDPHLHRGRENRFVGPALTLIAFALPSTVGCDVNAGVSQRSSSAVPSLTICLALCRPVSIVIPAAGAVVDKFSPPRGAVSARQPVGRAASSSSAAAAGAHFQAALAMEKEGDGSASVSLPAAPAAAPATARAAAGSGAAVAMPAAPSATAPPAPRGRAARKGVTGSPPRREMDQPPGSVQTATYRTIAYPWNFETFTMQR